MSDNEVMPQEKDPFDISNIFSKKPTLESFVEKKIQLLRQKIMILITKKNWKRFKRSLRIRSAHFMKTVRN